MGTRTPCSSMIFPAWFSSLVVTLQAYTAIPPQGKIRRPSPAE
jgi:hypothetical protein